jgi:hypothetical protein
MSLPTPYYDDGKGIQIYLGNCREILPHLPKVDLLLTDPPYGLADRWTGGTWGAASHPFGGGLVAAQMSAASQPMTVHPRRKLSRRMASWL